METLVQSTTEEVVNHHLAAFIRADLEEILKDFEDNSELLTPDGALKGLSSIRSFFEGVFKIVPAGSHLEVKQTFIRGNLAYLAWTCDSPIVSIPLGTDSFIIREGKIEFQTLAAHIVFK